MKKYCKPEIETCHFYYIDTLMSSTDYTTDGFMDEDWRKSL